MAYLISIVIGTLIFTFGLWLSVKIVGGSEGQNKLSTAAIFGVLFSTFGAFAGPFALIVLFGLFLLLLRYYELGILQAILVVVLMTVFSFAVNFALAMLFVALGLAS